MWKPVILNSDIVQGGIGDLIGIEELNCDSLENPPVVNKQGQKRKRNSKKAIANKKVDLERQDEIPLQDSGEDFLKHIASWSCFGIHESILKGLHAKGFLEPTEIQRHCLGPAMSGRDVLACAETGSGKTLAFAIPMVHGILKAKENSEDKLPVETKYDEEDWEEDVDGVGCVKVKNIPNEETSGEVLLGLVLTPTRELAVQVKSHIEDICLYTNIRVVLIVGGLAYEKQERLLAKRPQIVVATPGRLWELIDRGNSYLQTTHAVRFLAVDETDRMLEKGHFEELGHVLERLNFNETEKNQRQNFVLSATLTIVHDPPMYIKGKKRKRVTPGQKLQSLMDKIGITNAKVVDITRTKLTAEKLEEKKILCKFEDKDFYLYQLLRENSGRVIVFCNSIGSVKRMASLLNLLKLRPMPIHAHMEQKQRLRNLDKFKACRTGILLATDVAARGLDIPGVEHVIHYHMPRTAETYIHRSGRTARSGLLGAALLLVDPSEHRTYIKLLQTLGRTKDVEDLELDVDQLHHAKRIVTIAREIDVLTLAVKKQADKESWYKKAVHEMDMFVEEDEMPKLVSSEADSRIRKDLKRKQVELASLISMQPLPRHYSGKYPDVYHEVRRDLLNIPGAFVLKEIPGYKCRNKFT